VTPPGVPWNLLHLDWAADYLPFPRLAHDWQLGDVDFDLPATYEVPAADPGHPLSGRIPLSSAPAAVLAGAGDDPKAVPDADLLSGAVSDLAAQLRKDPAGAVVRHTDGSAPEGDPPTGTRPAGSIALRSGFLRLRRLRLVDGYGRFLDLPLGNVPVAICPNVLAHGNPDVVALKPRFTAPARVLLRYAAATGDQVDADAGVSPLCGFVVPSPLDGTLEFFDENGTRLGRLRPDDVTATAWEEDPGQPASYGGRPPRAAPATITSRCCWPRRRPSCARRSCLTCRTRTSRPRTRAPPYRSSWAHLLTSRTAFSRTWSATTSAASGSSTPPWPESPASPRPTWTRPTSSSCTLGPRCRCCCSSSRRPTST
jgi:hypothetical protein